MKIWDLKKKHLKESQYLQERDIRFFLTNQIEQSCKILKY